MADNHAGSIKLQRTLEEAHQWLALDRPVAFSTEEGEPFWAMAYTAGEGPHDGEKVIRIMRTGREFITVYMCCWGREHGCEGERIGPFLEALDEAVPTDLP